MDIFELVKEYGVSLVGLVALAYYVKTQNDWITNELQTELRESFTRLESIVIKLASGWFCLINASRLSINSATRAKYGL